MFNYLVLNAYLKPYQHIIRTFDEKFNDTSYAIAQQAKKDELKIFDLFIKKRTNNYCPNCKFKKS